jgi:hypothetical protein
LHSEVNQLTQHIIVQDQDGLNNNRYLSVIIVQRFVVSLRTFLLGGGGVLALFGSEAVGYNGAGPLCCIVAAFVACHGWRHQGYTDYQVSQ